jgi:hypothetical protein
MCPEKKQQSKTRIRRNTNKEDDDAKRMCGADPTQSNFYNSRSDAKNIFISQQKKKRRETTAEEFFVLLLPLSS